MEKFLAIAAGDNPMARARLEVLIYHYAEKYIKGYHGGHWTDAEEDGVLYLFPPEGATTLPHQDWGDCEFSDERAAGIAFTALLVNHLMWREHEAGNEDRANALHDWWEDLMKLALYSDKMSEEDRNAASKFLD